MATDDLKARLRDWRGSTFDYDADEYRPLPLALEAAAHIAELEAQLAATDAALNRALGVFDWLAENEPDCYGWNPPYPSTSPGIKSEADALRAMLAARPNVKG